MSPRRSVPDLQNYSVYAECRGKYARPPPIARPQNVEVDPEIRLSRRSSLPPGSKASSRKSELPQKSVVNEPNNPEEQEVNQDDSASQKSFVTTSSQKKYIEELEGLLKEERMKRIQAENSIKQNAWIFNSISLS